MNKRPSSFCKHQVQEFKYSMQERSSTIPLSSSSQAFSSKLRREKRLINHLKGEKKVVQALNYVEFKPMTILET